MIRTKISQTFRVCTALMLALFSTSISQVIAAQSASAADSSHEVVCHRLGNGGFNAIPPDQTSAHIPGHVEAGNLAHSDFIIFATYPDDAKWNDLKAGLETRCAAEDPALVVPAAPTSNDPCGTINDTYTIPSTANVIYKIGANTVTSGTYPGSGSVTITAEAAPGYLIGAGVTKSWTFTFATTACLIEVTPEAPTVDPLCGANNDILMLPTQTGVDYSSTGWIAGSLTVTATAQTGYVLLGQTSWTFSDVNVSCPIHVVATAPTVAANPCGTDNDTYTIPSTPGVDYLVDGQIVAAGTYSTNGALSVTITAQAAGIGFILDGTASWTLTFTNVPCLISVTPTAPSQKDVCELLDDTYTIPAKTGVEYLVNGQVTEAGTYNTGGASSVTITAQAVSGYVLTGTTSWDLDFTDNECAKVTLCHATHSGKNPYVEITVSAAAAFHGHLDDDFGGIHGNHQDGEDVIPPFTYNDVDYSQNWNDEGQALWNNHCNVMVTPSEPGFLDVCGDIYDDIIVIPSTTGVIYKINGVVAEAGWVPAPTDNVTVTAEAAEGYTLPVDATTSWEHAFTNEDCITITKTAMPLTDTNHDGILGVGDTVTWKITVTNNGDLWFENFEVQVSDANAVLENDGYIENLAPGESATIEATTLITAAHVSTVCKVENTALFGASYNAVELERAVLQNESLVLIDEVEPVVYDFTGSASAEMTFTCPSTGHVLDDTATTTRVLPATLPATGGEQGPLALVLAMIVAYGAVYFLQGRRQLNISPLK